MNNAKEQYSASDSGKYLQVEDKLKESLVCRRRPSGNRIFSNL